MSLLFFLLAGPGSSAERGGKNGFCGCGSCVSRWRWGRARRARRRQHRLQLLSPGPGLGEGHGAQRVQHRASSCTGRWKSTGLAGCGVLPGSPPLQHPRGASGRLGWWQGAPGAGVAPATAVSRPARRPASQVSTSPGTRSGHRGMLCCLPEALRGMRWHPGDTWVLPAWGGVLP